METSRLVYGYVDKIQSFSPDFLVVCDYGLFLPDSLLKIPKYAAFNVHHSLLPKYRGPSPAPTAILNGEKVSGVSIIEMSNKLDAGDIVAQKTYTLKPDETTESLLTTLNTIGAEILIDVLQQYEKGAVKKIRQNEKEATFTPHITKQDGYIDLQNPPSLDIIDRMIRAYYPWPGVWTKIRIMNNELRIKLLPEKKIQVEGKKPMSYKDFVNGYPEASAIILKLLEQVASLP